MTALRLWVSDGGVEGRVTTTGGKQIDVNWRGKSCGEERERERERGIWQGDLRVGREAGMTLPSFPFFLRRERCVFIGVGLLNRFLNPQGTCSC